MRVGAPKRSSTEGWVVRTRSCLAGVDPKLIMAWRSMFGLTRGECIILPKKSIFSDVGASRNRFSSILCNGVGN